MGEFPSGQRGQTVNLLAMPSMVRIHLPPPKIPIALLGDWYFSLPGRWSRSLSPSGEIHLPPPKYRLSFWTVGIFLCPPKISACFAGQLFNQLRRMHIAPGKPPNKIANPPPVRSADGFFVRLRSRLDLGAQPLRQLPARQTAYQRVETVGAHRQPAMRTRP